MISNVNNITDSKRRKHANLARPSTGLFGRNEYAFVGGHCNAIKVLADKLISALSPDCKCVYIDSSHNDDEPLPGRLASGANMEFTFNKSYKQLNCKAFNLFNQKQLFNEADLILVNGNHHQAKAQVVIIDNSKEHSLYKRLDQLTDVKLFLLAEGAEKVFDFIKDAVPGWQQIPVYKLDETESITAFFKEEIRKSTPVINGLVLAGGKSLRMGFDKGSVNWHGKEQKYYAADMLKTYCNEVYISCREEQKEQIIPGYLSIPDTFAGLGPFGAILSAFRKKPDCAWLVTACDMPLLEADTFEYLVANRNISAIATTFQSPVNNLPEPLITIWEPKSYSILLTALSQGYSCPRKVLINSNINLLTAPHPDQLTNVNTPDEHDRIKQVLYQKEVSE